VVAGRAAGAPQAIRAEVQSMGPTEEKRIIVHLPDTTTAETVGEQSREEIIERIRGDAGAAPANRQVVAVRKLKSGDLAVPNGFSRTFLSPQQAKCISVFECHCSEDVDFVAGVSSEDPISRLVFYTVSNTRQCGDKQ
jgi:hypothetical protein